MSLVDKTFSSRFKDLLVISNSNAGFDTNVDNVTSGNGNASSLSLSKNHVKIQPNADSTTNTTIYDKDGNLLFLIDSTNDYVKVGSGQQFANTQYREFGIFDFSPTQGYHHPLVVSNVVAATAGVLPSPITTWGNGTDPATTMDADTAGSTAKNLTAVYWYLQDAITIDAIRVIATCDSSENLNFHVMSYDLDTSSNHGDLSGGTLIAHINSVMAATSTSIKTDTLVIDSASIAAGKIVVVFVENEGGTGDITCQATIKYHLI